MNQTLRATQSSVFLKAAMAASGLGLFGFVVVHMLGNLQLYAGPEKLNAYAALLKSMPGLLWGARLGLLAIVIVHVSTAIALYQRNTEARPERYRHQKHQVTSYAARTMYWSGPILLLYIAYHLAHLTLGLGAQPFSPTDVYSNVVIGFQQPWIAGVYIIGNLALGKHLFHGLWSIFQSLGLNHPRWNGLRRGVALGGAGIVTVGNLSFPISVLLGFVTLPA